MVKAADLLGRAVVSREGGRELGKVKDLVVDHSGKRVLGVVVSEGLLRGTKVALWPSVLAVGPHSVVLDSARSVVDADDAPEIKSVLEKGTHIRGLKLQTTEGKELGKIEDFQLDEESGTILGYELSSGLFADTFGGHPFLPAPPTIELGKEIAFIAPEVEGTIQGSTGGIKGAFRRDKAPAGGDEAAERQAPPPAGTAQPDEPPMASSEQPPQQG
jgi:uncharacterized protein YrrD